MFKIDGTCWLTPGEQREVVKLLLQNGLVVMDNGRKLPLKSGGTTDIYLNLRNMRNHPEAIRELANLYANPIRRLHVDRIVEVPEAVSPLAGHLSAILNIPIVTVRETAKTGRVVSGQLIGEVKFGESIVIVDDVVTDGASKLAAIRELRAKGANIAAIVVLVDRQQGWKKTLAEAGYGDVPVWAGLTLHDVRAELIGSGLMQRCNPETEAKNPLIIALDGMDPEQALSLADRLRPSGCILKANDFLDTGNLNEIVAGLSVYGRVMVDGKWHDIPNTVANRCKRLLKTPPWAVTVHASGGRNMVAAAVNTLDGTKTIVLAVTLLTSIGDECEEIFTRRPIGQVKKLAQMAYDAGARGFVCSTQEAAMLRKMFPEVTIVVPALRSPDKDVQDQKRVGTFAGAQEAGASNYVGGRQFIQAPDPVAEINRVIKDELHIEL